MIERKSGGVCEYCDVKRSASGVAGTVLYGTSYVVGALKNEIDTARIAKMSNRMSIETISSTTCHYYVYTIRKHSSDSAVLRGARVID